MLAAAVPMGSAGSPFSKCLQQGAGYYSLRLQRRLVQFEDLRDIVVVDEADNLTGFVKWMVFSFVAALVRS
jgi:hypothetical protein